LLAIAKLPLATILEKLRIALVRFVNVTVLAVLVSPTASVPKFKLVDERETGALPFPEGGTV
jgi:hypothetical protein